MAQNKILIVDNEIEMVQLLGLHLSREGFSVVWTTDGNEAVSLVRNEAPDLIVLDVVMPSISGIDVCAQIREFSDVPIIFLSCKNQVPDKILALGVGGDDYITKPFSPLELIARIKTNLKRAYTTSRDITASQQMKGNTLCHKELCVDLDAYTAKVEGTLLNLTNKEFELLVLLLRSPNRVFTPKQIFEHLWNTYGIEEEYRTVMVHISNLRKKFDAYPEYASCIQTVRGVGYKYVKN